MSDKSYPRKYGPSNWQERPQETRPKAADDVPTQLREVIWDAASLMREQYRQALEDNEFSPDALMGVEEVIGEARTSSTEATKLREAFNSNRDQLALVIWGLQQANKIPADYLKEKGHPSIQHDKGGMDLLESLKRDQFRMTDDPMNLYIWENIQRILRVTALYLDEMKRMTN